MFDFLMPEKDETVYFFDISITFNLGFVANLDETGATNDSIWIPLGDEEMYKKYIGKLLLNHKNITIKTLINNIEIFNNDLTAMGMSYQLTHKFKFLKDTVTNLLEFKISGFDQQHMLLLPTGLGARPAIKIQKINFEDVNILTVFTEQSKFHFNDLGTTGDFTFSCNGTSKFEFETPIYSWLVKNRHLAVCY